MKERVNEVLDQTEPQKATPCKEIERATSEDITDDEVVVVKREEFSEALQAMKTPGKSCWPPVQLFSHAPIFT